MTIETAADLIFALTLKSARTTRTKTGPTTIDKRRWIVLADNPSDSPSEMRTTRRLPRWTVMKSRTSPVVTSTGSLATTFKSKPLPAACCDGPEQRRTPNTVPPEDDPPGSDPTPTPPDKEPNSSAGSVPEAAGHHRHIMQYRSPRSWRRAIARAAEIDPRFDQRLSDTLTSTWALLVPHGLEGHHPRVKDSRVVSIQCR
jgi:hypothetical protein